MLGCNPGEYGCNFFPNKMAKLATDYPEFVDVLNAEPKDK